MKRKLFSILTALALCLSLCPAPALALEDPEPQGEQETPQDGQEDQGQTVQEAFDGGVPVKRTERSAETGTFSGKAAGRLGTVDLSDSESDSGQGYTWTATRDSQSQKITDGTLTLADGFDAETLILPDAAVTIVTEGTCIVGTLAPPNDLSGYPSAHQMQLTFSGEGTLTIREHVEISGGYGNSLTVAENTELVAKNGITIGESGVNGLITVDGTLKVTQGTGVSAIYAGRVSVNTTGVLEISGESGMFLAGTISEPSYSDLFAVKDNGRFTAECSVYTIRVQLPGGSFPEGTEPRDVIPLGEDYLPSNCALSIKSGLLDFIDITTGQPYTGAITIHQTHDWNLDDWVNDETGHWHGCRYEGCDKKYGGNSLAHSLSWQTSDSEHWQECSVCGYETIHAAHTSSTAYLSDETGHWHPCEVCEKKTEFAVHTPAGDYLKDASGHWKKCSVCGGDTKHVAHRPKDGYQKDDYNHWFTCADCGYETTHTAHSLENQYNENNHWQECVCGYETTHMAHSLEYRHDENNHWQECVCGYRTTDEPHTPGTEYQHDADGHWQVCTACGEEAEREPHVYDSSRDAVCNLCGYRRKIDSGSSGSSGSGGGGGWMVSSYAVTVEKSEHGKVASSRTSAASGSTVTLTVTPDGGYALDTLTVTDGQGTEVKLTAQGGGKYAFTMPARAVTVRAVFAPLSKDAGTLCDGSADCPSRSFADLGGPETWYHEAVDFVLQNGLMGGYGNGTFGPDNPLTRAQLVQILYNQAGRPTVTGGGFSDVAPGTWCADAVAWAAERGIAGGYGDGRFGPNDPISREQLAVLLWRYAGSPAAAGREELPFSDAGQAGGYAREALRWAVENGVISGKSGGVLAPKGPATRAQAAQMLKNYEER